MLSITELAVSGRTFKPGFSGCVLYQILEGTKMWTKCSSDLLSLLLFLIGPSVCMILFRVLAVRSIQSKISHMGDTERWKDKENSIQAKAPQIYLSFHSLVKKALPADFLLVVNGTAV